MSAHNDERPRKDVECGSTRDLDLDKGEAETRNVGNLQRRLKSRHVQFLALSGAIGTGLFVGAGQVLSLAGPLSATLAYLITGFNLYAVINSMGKWLLGYLFLDGTIGISLLLESRSKSVPLRWSSTIGQMEWPRLYGSQFFMWLYSQPIFSPVRVYGELEFVLGSIKLTTIVGLMLLMLIITLGGAPTHDRIGFRYWQQPGPMNEYLQNGSLGRFLAFWKVFIQATFSYGGSEMVVVAAGETENPRRNIPKAVRRVFWRIAIFYVGSVFLVGMCVSSRDPRLLNAIESGADTASASPFVIAIENGRIQALPSIINAVILTSALSAGNSFFYASTRILYATALDGKAPRILSYEKFGVPYVCVLVTAALSLLVYLNVSASSAEVFFWISNLSSVSTLIVWSSIAVTYIRFYRGLRHNGISRDTLPFKSPFQPYMAYFALIFSSTVALFNGFDAFFPGHFSATSFVPPYVDIPIFATLFLGYKFIKGTNVVNIEDMDLWSGKEEADRLESTWEEPKPRNILEKIWFWIA
ncbi:hypothetical protein N7450_003626 [Penicillium hetheringtonii]|uniref:Amino acid permease/ SLC12A domain-containing protein n=1 Tax=Penicillium hetheringtonii TaxID=911720 RepID=A0AAD6DY89_9EURO|nr:hypothetical protein N7450_003626 [Penicillium hetheringtonii]